jgi:phosphate transport system permease protein
MGETMAVIMVAGNSPMIPEPFWNIFSKIQVLTSTIAMDATSDLSPENALASVLFLLGLVLMLLVLLVNIIAKFIINRSRKKFAGEKTFSPMDKLPGHKAVAPYMPGIRRSFTLLMIFIFVWMMTSLLMDGTLSAIPAFAAVAALVSFRTMMSKIGSVRRQKIMHSMLLGIVVLVMAMLAWLVGDIVVKGLPALSVDFVTSFPVDNGIFPAIVGTLYLMAGTMLIAFPLGIVTGIYLSEYARNGPVTKLIREAIDILNATPSIVFGLFGAATIMLFIGNKAMIAGCVTLAIMVLPMIIRTTEETIRSVPRELREASFAMGATKWQTTSKVVLPAAFGGVITGMILAIGRAAGETAPIMLTAAVGFMTVKAFTLDPTMPLMALPYQLYHVSWVHPVGWTIQEQYGIALVLMLLVLSLFALATIIRYRYSKKVRW